MIVLLTIIACAGCDQVTKAVARSVLPPDRALTFAGDTVRLQLTKNEGAFLSLGASLPGGVRDALFTVGVGVMVGALALYAFFDTRSRPSRLVALALVAGGGVGNLLDRLAYGGYVVDFLNVGIGPLRTGIFNVADVTITAGAVLLLIGVRSPARNV